MEKTRKELQEEYKNLKFRQGVFQIRNTENGKVFIEASSNLDKIWNRHLFQLNMGGHPNAELQRDWKIFGRKNSGSSVGRDRGKEGGELDFNKEIKLLEQLYFEELQPYGNKGYHQKPDKVVGETPTTTKV